MYSLGYHGVSGPFFLVIWGWNDLTSLSAQVLSLARPHLALSCQALPLQLFFATPSPLQSTWTPARASQPAQTARPPNLDGFALFRDWLAHT